MERPEIKMADLEQRDNLTYHEIQVQNDLLREALTEALTKAQTLTHKCEAYEIDIRNLEDRVQELSRFETMDKAEVIKENARLYNLHQCDALTIENLTRHCHDKDVRIIALEGCLSRAHEAITTGNIINESYKQQNR